jgi:hypothetical protein
MAYRGGLFLYRTGHAVSTTMIHTHILDRGPAAGRQMVPSNSSSTAIQGRTSELLRP